MEPFKEKINASSVRLLAAELARGTPSFPEDSFASEASVGLGALELKARVRHVAQVLRAHLPDDLECALDVLLAGIDGPSAPTGAVTEAFRYWPVLQVVEDHGVARPEASLRALKRMTCRFSGEFAIRPLLEHHPELAWAAVERWAADDNVHVRRLASEGTRPRLPWGRRLDASVEDPSRGLELITRLVDDPERYVRQSVANHLNDVTKDHPEQALRQAAAWLEHTTPERQRAARHGLRTLFRCGHKPTLALFGFGAPSVQVQGPVLSPAVVQFGTHVVLSLGLTSTASEPAALRVEWVFHYPRGRKVFRGPERTLQPGETWQIDKRFPMRPITTRKHRPGTHRVAVQVNGEVLAEGCFELVGGDA